MKNDYRRDYRRTEYVEGNTVRKAVPRREEVRNPRRVANPRKRSHKNQVVDLGFVLFLTMALAITGVTCLQYILLQSSITNHVKTISSLEIELQGLKAENDDYEGRIKGAVDLESVKRRAMDDLGMTYADETQIVVYESDGTDYVRQFVSIE